MLKLSKSKKKIKETEYSEPKNYWNKTNYICLSDYTTKKYRERWVTFKRIICGYSCWNLLDNFRSCKKKKWEIKESNVKISKSPKIIIIN